MTILFKEYNTFQNVQTILDTIPLDMRGKFAKEFDYNAGIYQVEFVGFEKVNIAVERGQMVNIKLTLPSAKNPITKLKISGSPDAILIFEYDQKQKAAYDKWLHPVRRDIRLAKEAGNTEIIPELTKKEQDNLIAYQNELAEFAQNNFGNSIALFYAAIRLNPSFHLVFMQHIADLFNKTRPDLALTKKYNARIARFKQTRLAAQLLILSLKLRMGKE